MKKIKLTGFLLRALSDTVFGTSDTFFKGDEAGGLEIEAEAETADALVTLGPVTLLFCFWRSSVLLA